MSNPPVVIAFAKIKRTRRKIILSYSKGEETHNVGNTENALPAFDLSMAELTLVALSIAKLSKDLATNARATELRLQEKAGADQASITLHIALPDASGPLVIVTPFRYLQNPSEEGTYTPCLPEADAAKIMDVVENARDYAIGKRAQGVLPGVGLVEDDGEDENEGGGEKKDDGPKLPGTEDAAAAVKPKRTRKPKADANVEKFPGHGNGQP